MFVQWLVQRKRNMWSWIHDISLVTDCKHLVRIGDEHTGKRHNKRPFKSQLLKLVHLAKQELQQFSIVTRSVADKVLCQKYAERNGRILPANCKQQWWPSSHRNLIQAALTGSACWSSHSASFSSNLQTKQSKHRKTSHGCSAFTRGVPPSFLRIDSPDTVTWLHSPSV